MERPGQEPNAVAPKPEGVAPGPTELWELQGVRQAGRASLPLSGPQVFGRMVRSVRRLYFLIGVFVASALGAAQGAADQMGRALGRHGRGPDRDGKPVGDLMAE